MRKIVLIVLLALALSGCRKESTSFIVQVSLGGWNSPDYSAEQIIDRLDAVIMRIPVKAVIIGWSTDKDIYWRVGRYLHGQKIDMFLWLPVFAETEDMCENSPALDLWGNVPANYDLTAGEGFRFNCPSDAESVADIIDIYDSCFSYCGFDGVFLDRIRTQSFVSGVSGVLSCGCPGCAELFLEEGVDLQEVRDAWEAKGDEFFSVSGYTPQEGFVFADPLAAAFFKAKGKIVSESVATVADCFRNHGLKVGMDLYAPFMAPFVGQDYAILSEHADFIKPMLYRQTFAPAGMGFEYDLLKKAVPGFPAGGHGALFLRQIPWNRNQLQGRRCSYEPAVHPRIAGCGIEPRLRRRGALMEHHGGAGEPYRLPEEIQIARNCYLCTDKEDCSL